MTELLNDLATPSDAELISSVRGGDVTAYGDLFARHHEAANRLARQLVRGPDADDLVSDAFAKVLTVLQGGGGPDVAFRAYLLTALRRLHVDKMRAGAKLHTSDDMTTFDPGVPFFDTAVASFESGAAAKAFATLPERWQLVLWHLEVEGNKPAEIAPLLGMSPNSVSALAYRAREGLRQAFLTMHLNDISETDCRWVNDHLGAFVRKGLSNRDHTKVQSHLDQCRRCTAMYLELTEVNSNLAAIIAPLLLGAAATGYVASAGAGGATAGLLALFGRARDVFAANASAATAGAVTVGAATVAAAVTAAVVLLPGDPGEAPRAADRPADSSSALPSAPTSDPSDPSDADPDRDRTVAAPSDTTAAPTPTSSDLPVNVPVGAAADPTQAEGPLDEPAPTEPPGDGPPSPDPSDLPPPRDVDVTVAASLVGDQVDLTLEGSPALPDHVTVRLVSRPGGITFVDDVCRVSDAQPTTAVCSIEEQPGRLARARAAAPASYTVRIPMAVPTAQPDSELDLEIDLPAGFRDPRPDDNRTRVSYRRPSSPPPPPTATVDLALAPLQVPTSIVTTEGVDTFRVTTSLSGAPLTVPVSLRLDGAGVSLSAAPPGCTLVDARTVTCLGTGAPLDLALPLALAPGAPATDVTVTALVPDGYADPVPGDNTSPAATLRPALKAELSLGTVTEDHGGVVGTGPGTDISKVTVPVLGVPVGLTTFDLEVNGDLLVEGAEGCEASATAPHTFTCAATARPRRKLCSTLRWTTVSSPVSTSRSTPRSPTSTTATTTTPGITPSRCGSASTSPSAPPTSPVTTADRLVRLDIHDVPADDRCQTG